MGNILQVYIIYVTVKTENKKKNEKKKLKEQCIHRSWTRKRHSLIYNIIITHHEDNFSDYLLISSQQKSKIITKEWFYWFTLRGITRVSFVQIETLTQFYPKVLKLKLANKAYSSRKWLIKNPKPRYLLIRTWRRQASRMLLLHKE